MIRIEFHEVIRDRDPQTRLFEEFRSGASCLQNSPRHVVESPINVMVRVKVKIKVNIKVKARVRAASNKVPK